MQSNRPVSEPEVTVNLGLVRRIAKVNAAPDFKINFHYDANDVTTWIYDSEANRDAEFALIHS